jgi:hypothetical protein
MSLAELFWKSGSPKKKNLIIVSGARLMQKIGSIELNETDAAILCVNDSVDTCVCNLLDARVFLPTGLHTSPAFITSVKTFS